MPRTIVRLATPRQVVDRILALIAAFPEQIENAPERLHTRAYWSTLLDPKSAQGARALAVLREVPAFRKPLPKTRAGWERLFGAEMGLGQVRDMLLLWSSIAGSRQPKRLRVAYWREAYGADERVQRIRPREHDEWIANPHRGTTTFQRFQGDELYPSLISSDAHGPLTFPARPRRRDNRQYIARTTLSYCRWPWKVLEPEKGRYAWDIIDGALATAGAVGQTLQLRFQPYTSRWDTAKHPPRAKRYPPESSVNVPDWYWDTGAAWIPAGPYARNEPDSNDPLYLQHFGDFIRAFAARYDGHPLLESVDVAYAGFWGESGGNASDATAARLVDVYLESFRRTQLLGLLLSPGCAHAAKRHPRLGWRADCFGDLKESLVLEVPENAAWNHTYDAYPKHIAQFGLKDAWKTAPVTMESCWNVAAWMMRGFDLDRIIEEGYRYHTSVFMPKSTYFPEATMAKLERFDRRIGYRFALRQLLLPLQVERGRTIHAECFLDNVGCAPIYRPYVLALRLSQGRTVRVVRFAEDIRGWLPGHSFFAEDVVLPPVFEPGEVKVALGLVDAEDVPRVWFAIAGPTDAGWHPLTSIDVR